MYDGECRDRHVERYSCTLIECRTKDSLDVYVANYFGSQVGNVLFILKMLMMTTMKMPIYFACHFFNEDNREIVYMYKINTSDSDAHPFQLYKLVEGENSKWQNLSVYASVHDAVKVFLKELFSKDLREDIGVGQAIVNPREILKRLDDGERFVSICGPNNLQGFQPECDVIFNDLVER